MEGAATHAAFVGKNRRYSAVFAGSGLALGVILGLALGVVEASLPESFTHTIEATDGWVLWLLFVGVPAAVAYTNDGLAACWVFNYGLLFPYFLAWQPSGTAGDLQFSFTAGQRVVFPLILAILFGSLAFGLGLGVRWTVRTLRADASPDIAGVVPMVVGRNRRRAVATSLAGIGLGAVVVLVLGFDVPLLGRDPTAPEHKTLHWLLIGTVLLFAAAAAYSNDGLIPVCLLAGGFLVVVYMASFRGSYGIGQAVFSAFFTGITFGSVGFLLGFVARWVVTRGPVSPAGGESSV